MGIAPSPRLHRGKSWRTHRDRATRDPDGFVVLCGEDWLTLAVMAGGTILAAFSFVSAVRIQPLMDQSKVEREPELVESLP